MPNVTSEGMRKCRVKGLKVNFIVFEMMYFQQALTITIENKNKRLMKYVSS